MKKDPSIIRVGDQIEIINPEYVDRVGYPLCKKDIVAGITQDQKNRLYKAANEIFGLEIEDFNNSIFVKSNKEYKLLYALAEMILLQKKFGGSERSIHTKIEESYMGQIFTVLERKVVKTGTYVPGGGGYCSYTGEYDYDSAYLENEKTHVLYGVSDGGLGKCIYFEKRNVKKITKS